MRDASGENYVFSNSEAQTFKECRRKWWLSYHRQLEPMRTVTHVARDTGTLVHEAVRRYYRANQDIAAAMAYLEFERAQSVEQVAESDVPKVHESHDLAWLIVEGYFEWLEATGADARWTIEATETSITIDGDIPRTKITGKLDLQVHDGWSGQRMTVDHKDQPLSSLILTDTGWRTNGELSVGDLVADPVGGWAKVTELHPKGMQPIVKVSFRDGTSVCCGLGHLWEVHDIVGRSTRVVTTQEMMTKGIRCGQNHRWFVPLVSPIESEEVVLPLDPYILGAWLGDGTSGAGHITVGERDIAFMTATFTSLGYPLISLSNPILYSISGVGRPLLRSLGVLQNKHVPEMYFRGSIQQRLALLRGLMDTDGSAKGHGHFVFCNSNKRLVDDVAALVRSLGGVATPWEYTPSGNFNPSGPAWQVHVSMTLCPFLMPRKAARWHPRKMALRKAIVSIEPAGLEETQCISVDSVRNTYITDDYIVTHNTIQSFQDVQVTLHLNEQAPLYVQLQRRGLKDNPPLTGAVWNMMRKVKRGPRSKPPYYARTELVLSDSQLERFWEQFHGQMAEILRVEDQLRNGAKHQVVAYPTPSGTCNWKCPFFAVCGSLNDPQDDAEYLLESNYVIGNPLARYDENNLEGAIIS